MKQTKKLPGVITRCAVATRFRTVSDDNTRDGQKYDEGPGDAISLFAKAMRTTVVLYHIESTNSSES